MKDLADQQEAKNPHPFSFRLFLLTGRYTMSNFAGRPIWEMKKEGEAWKSQQRTYFCSNLTPAKKMPIIKRATNDNVFPAHSNRSQTAGNHWTVIATIMEPLLVSDKTAL